MARYRFALAPKWIVSHLFVLALIITMINLGLWQLRRLDDKRARNDKIEAHIAAATVPVTDLVGADDPEAAVGPVEFRRVTATGRYLADDEVLVRSRSLDGAPGSWVLTPLDLGDGTAVVVNRGWISDNGSLTRVPSSVAAPSGEVEVTGLLRPSETRGSFGPKDPPTGTLRTLARADVDRLDQQVDAELLPGWIQLVEQDPAVGADDPKPVPRPELDEGPHLSYAFQWFFFTSVAVVGYPLILRRRAREGAIEALGDPEAEASA